MHIRTNNIPSRITNFKWIEANFRNDFLCIYLRPHVQPQITYSGSLCVHVSVDPTMRYKHIPPGPRPVSLYAFDSNISALSSVQHQHQRDCHLMRPLWQVHGRASANIESISWIRACRVLSVFSCGVWKNNSKKKLATDEHTFAMACLTNRHESFKNEINHSACFILEFGTLNITSRSLGIIKNTVTNFLLCYGAKFIPTHAPFQHLRLFRDEEPLPHHSFSDGQSSS